MVCLSISIITPHNRITVKYDVIWDMIIALYTHMGMQHMCPCMTRVTFYVNVPTQPTYVTLGVGGISV